MSKYFVCRVGHLCKDSHFYKTVHIPIVQQEYSKIRWALNEISFQENTRKFIEKEITEGNNIYVVLFPNIPNNYPYAICKLNSIKKRELGPLVSLDETNTERGWDKKTSSEHSDFTYDLNFKEIYLLNENSFNGIKLKGQRTFFELKPGKKNEDLLIQIKEEMKYIKLYVKPIYLP